MNMDPITITVEAAMANLLKQAVNVTTSPEVLEILRDNLKKKGLYKEEEADMGATEAEVIASGIKVPDNDSTYAARALQSVDASMIDLKVLYKNKQRRLNTIFTLCLVAIGASILLIFAGLAVSFSEANDARLGIITSASSLLPGFIGATAFIFYDKVKRDAQKLEDNLINLNGLVIFFRLIDAMPEGKVKADAFAEMSKRMSESVLRPLGARA